MGLNQIARRTPVKLFLCVVAVFALSLPAAAESWTGTISDSRCGAKHAAGSTADLDCINACMKRGAVPVLVVPGGKVYSIATESVEKVTPHLGKKVTITGKTESQRFAGELIIVESIAKAE
jgi:hypothetical protein